MAKLTKAQQAEAEEARAALRKLLPPGTTVRTILRHVSSSGMSRTISPVVANKDGSIVDLEWLIVKAQMGFRAHPSKPGLQIGGAGMDMGFSLVYSLSRSLYPDGYKCSGHDGSKRAPRCNSNDHSNYRPWIEQGTWNRETHEWEGRIDNPEPNFKKGKHHSDGGYALNQAWL